MGTVHELVEAMSQMTEVEIPDMLEDGEDPITIYEQLKELQSILSNSMNSVAGASGMPYQERLLF